MGKEHKCPECKEGEIVVWQQSANVVGARCTYLGCYALITIKDSKGNIFCSAGQIIEVGNVEVVVDQEGTRRERFYFQFNSPGNPHNFEFSPEAFVGLPTLSQLLNKV